MRKNRTDVLWGICGFYEYWRGKMQMLWVSRFNSPPLYGRAPIFSPSAFHGDLWTLEKVKQMSVKGLTLSSQLMSLSLCIHQCSLPKEACLPKAGSSTCLWTQKYLGSILAPCLFSKIGSKFSPGTYDFLSQVVWARFIEPRVNSL